MICPVCQDRGCSECVGRGRIDIGCCPLDYVTGEINDLLDYVELFEKGLPPVAGGTLDQSKNFLIVADLIFKEQRIWRNRLGIF